jgi:hypothetical protein
LRLKLKTAIKEEKPKVQESMPTLTNALESHTKKVNATTTITTSTKLTLEIVVIVVSISAVILNCFAAYGFVNPLLIQIPTNIHNVEVKFLRKLE